MVGTLGLTCRRVLAAIASVTVVVVPIVARQPPASAATGGVTITHFTDPTISGPFGITAGPDGALWFTNNNNSIGRITTSGSVTNFTDPTISEPFAITAGPDGALWFTNFPLLSGVVNAPIGRITTDGAVTSYPTNGFPEGITAGPDGALWFTDFASNSIGRITVPQPTVVPFGGVVTEGTSGTTQLDVTVTLSHPYPQPVTAQWNTLFINGASNVQAIPDTDYTPASGTVTFPPGATTETVPITVVNHDLGMPYNLLVVSFHNPTNATMGGYWGLAFGFLLNNTG